VVVPAGKRGAIDDPGDEHPADEPETAGEPGDAEPVDEGDGGSGGGKSG
jgi:hypothetical protein